MTTDDGFWELFECSTERMFESSGRGANCGCRGECGIICGERDERQMPTIAESKKGKIKIAVNYSDHNPPHFHVIRGKKTIALVSIRDAVVLEGSLSRALLHRVLGWCVSHTKELLADWELARLGKEPKWIDWTID